MLHSIISIDEDCQGSFRNSNQSFEVGTHEGTPLQLLQGLVPQAIFVIYFNFIVMPNCYTSTSNVTDAASRVFIWVLSFQAIHNELATHCQDYCKIHFQILLGSLACLILFLGSRHNSRWDHVDAVSALPTSRYTATGSRRGGQIFR